MLQVIVACHDAGRYIARNVAALRAQSVATWRCHVVDDASADDTFEAAQRAIAGDPRFSLVQNASRVGLLANHDALMRRSDVDDEDVAIVVDGDDWLAHDDALAGVMEAYADGSAWITYGQFTVFDGVHYRVGFSAPPAHPDRVRRCRWTTSHLRTWKVHLWRRLDPSDLRLPGTDRYWPMAGDQAAMLPMLELAGPRRAKFLPEVSYVYNRENPGNDDKVDAELQRKCARAIRARPARAPVPEPDPPHEARATERAADDRLVSVCFALKTTSATPERTEALWTTLEALAGLGDERLEVVVGDFGSELSWERARSLLPGKLVLAPVAGAFNRSAGCNAASRSARGAVLLFLDADIVVTEAAIEAVRRHVAPGRCYYPQVRYLGPGQRAADVRDPSALFVGTGCGVCAFDAADFRALGGWDESLGTNWGGEDRELYDRAQRRLRVVRDEPRVLHQWHPTSLDYKDRFADRRPSAGPWKEYRNAVAALEGQAAGPRPA